MFQFFPVCRPQGMNIKIYIKIPEDKPQERVKTCRSCNVLIAKFLCYTYYSSFVGIFLNSDSSTSSSFVGVKNRFDRIYSFAPCNDPIAC